MLNKITGIILAGGQSSRMNGQDKGLIEINGQSLCKNLYKKLLPQVSDIIISCNQNLEQYQTITPHCQTDIMTGSLGPLAGIHACLQNINTPYFIVLPCDLHDIPNNLAKELVQTLEREQADLCYLQNDDNPYYLVMLGKASLQDTLTSQLQQQDLKVRNFIQKTKHCKLMITKKIFSFSNINNKKELEDLLKNL